MSGRRAVRWVVVAVDGSPSSLRAVRLFAETSSAISASLSVIHVVAVHEVPILIAEVEDRETLKLGQIVLSDALGVAREYGVRARGGAASRGSRGPDPSLCAISPCRPGYPGNPGSSPRARDTCGQRLPQRGQEGRGPGSSCALNQPGEPGCREPLGVPVPRDYSWLPPLARSTSSESWRVDVA